MSIAEQQTATPEMDRSDPFFYGFRYVRKDGKWEQVPLTREDVLHPEVDDRLTTSRLHALICEYLCSVCRLRLSNDPQAAYFHDIKMIWDIPGLRHHGPDLAVVLGVREQKPWSSFDVREEGVRPSLLVEISSPSTWDIDLFEKVDHYALARVPLYVVIDVAARRHVRTPRLVGYRLVDGQYEHFNAAEPNQIWLEPLGVWLRLVDGEVVCFDEQNVRIPNILELDHAFQDANSKLDDARQELSHERQALAAAEQRIRELEAELRRQRESE